MAKRDEMAGLHGDPYVVLGDGEYHARIGHDEETGIMFVWFVDPRSGEFISVPDAELAVEMHREGETRRFPVPYREVEEYERAEYCSDDPNLYESVGRPGTRSRLILVIGGESFEGEVPNFE